MSKGLVAFLIIVAIILIYDPKIASEIITAITTVLTQHHNGG